MTRDSPDVPVSEAELTSRWFHSVFAGHRADAVPTLASMTRTGRDYGLSSVLLRCRLVGPGCPRSVIVKLWPTDGPAGINEVRFYASFAENLGIRVPVSYHGAIDEPRKRGMLVLEDLEDAVQGDCLHQLDPAGAAAFARTLAALHATWWKRPELDEAKWLPSIVERNPEWLVSRRERFLQRFADRVDPAVRQLLGRVEPMQTRSNARLVGAPTTLLHGDLHLDNVVFVGGSDHPVLLDWARVARGPAALDLAELLFAIAPVEQLERTLGGYLGELLDRGISDMDERSLRHQLGGALLRKIVSATCGVARWEPASVREREMIDLGLHRITQAIKHWRRLDPELFEL